MRRSRAWLAGLAGAALIVLAVPWASASSAGAAAPAALSAARANPTPHVRRHQFLSPMAAVSPAARVNAAASSPAPLPGSGSWTALGPQPVAASDSSGVWSGRITALAVDPASGGSTVYAGTADGGVWKSTDSGAHWAATSDTQVTLAIGALAIDSRGPATAIYAGTGEGNACTDCLPSQGVLKSTDGGTSWSLLGQATFTAARFEFESLAVDSSNGNVFAATDRGLYESTDGGTTWLLNTSLPAVARRINPNTAASGGIDVVVQDPTTPTRYWAALGDWCQTEKGSIATSADGGVTWTDSANFPSFTNVASRIGLGVGKNGVAYAAVAGCDSSNPPFPTGQLLGLVKTSNGGGAWATIPPGTPGLVDFFAFPGNVGYQGWYDDVVAVDPSDANHAVFGGITMLVTADGGQTFSDVAKPYTVNPLQHPDFHAVAFNGLGSFYSGNDGGVWSTADFGVNWSNLNQTLQITQFYSGTALSLNYMVGGSQDNGTDGIVPGGPMPPQWKLVFDGDGTWTAMDPTPGSKVIYAANPGLGIFRGDYATPPSGWTPAAPCSSANTDPACHDPVSFTAPFVMDPSTPSRLYAATDRVYRTVSGGVPAGYSSWMDVSGLVAYPTPPPGFTGSDFIATMTIGSRTTPSTVLTGSWYGKVTMSRNASDRCCASWTDITGDLPALTGAAYTHNAWITGVAVNSSNNDEVWVSIGSAGTDRVFHTVNANPKSFAIHWTALTGSGATALPAVMVDSVTVDPLNPQVIYVGTDAGALVCTTCGGSNATGVWYALGTGLPNARVDAISLTPDAYNLVAWTHGRSAWTIKRSFPTPTADVSPTTLDFGSQSVSTTSPPKTVTLSNNGTAPLSITSIGASGDFGQTNNCGSALIAGSTCQIQVTFGPTVEGSLSGAVTLSDNAASSPQTVPLSGSGSRWDSLGGQLNSGPDASSFAGTSRMDVFARCLDNELCHRSFDGTNWSAWEALGGHLTSDPSAVSWASGRIDVFARGSDNGLWHAWFDSGTWSGWQDLGGILASGPDVSSWAARRLDVFAKCLNGTLCHKWFDGTAWSAWQSLGGQFTSDPSAVSWGNARIDVFTRGSDRALWHLWYDGSGWSAWQNLGGFLASGPDVASWGVGRLDVFAQCQDASLCHKFYDSGVGSWSAWSSLGGQWTSDPGAVAPASGRIEIFARGPDGAIWHRAISG